MILFFQISFVFFALFSAIEEVHFGYPFRELGDDQFPPDIKRTENKKAHRAGALGVFCLLFMAAFADASTVQVNKVFVALLTFSGCGFTYWLVFDIGYSLGIGKGAFYLGNTAGTDNRVVKLFGKKAGLKKALFCVLILIAINLIYKLSF